MAKSPEDMTKSMIRNMQQKTGKPLSSWLVIAKSAGYEKHGQLVRHLKTEFGVTHGYANLVANEFFKRNAEGDGDLVEAQYGGSKAGLRPIYEAIVKEVSAFGADVEIAPKKANVSLRRSKQFGLNQPSTKTRLDIGIKLKDKAPIGKLEASGSFNAMVTHRVRIKCPSDFDSQVVEWLREAYEQA